MDPGRLLTIAVGSALVATAPASAGARETAPDASLSTIQYAKDRGVSRNTIVVPSWDAAGCVAALEATASRIAGGIRDLAGADPDYPGDHIRLTFAGGDRVMDELEFFDWAVSCGEPAILPLRKIWAAFDKQATAGGWIVFDPRYDEETGALAHAALALARLDPEAYRSLALWFFLRDIEHEPFGGRRVLPAIAETSGWATKEAIAFGLFAIALQEVAGPYRETWPLVPNLVGSARRLYTPDEFFSAAR